MHVLEHDALRKSAEKLKYTLKFTSFKPSNSLRIRSKLIGIRSGLSSVLVVMDVAARGTDIRCGWNRTLWFHLPSSWI